ncbi:epididymal-specific lipocalin-10-like [Prionailurus viverrinus]|uniref:epididymal-specific lipocalin-10-like n=1 Tax=Prionailurus viverrinus TaxID=61388 RepID=UPI001FF5EA9D|nr:epididymal-specific lipocalin-10-like [Prionailurus viverrinus]
MLLLWKDGKKAMFRNTRRRNTSSFPSMKRLVDTCETLELADGATVLPKDGDVWSGATPPPPAARHCPAPCAHAILP